MKRNLLSLLCVGALLAPAVASAEYHTSFDVPPYVLNGTVVGEAKAVGIDGWRESVGSSSALQNAVVVTAPWDPETTVLRLQKSHRDDGYVRIMNNSFAPMTGVVELKFGMALDFPVATNKGGGTRVTFRDLSQVAAPLAFGVEYSATGGLYYEGSGGSVVLLPKNEIKMNSVYEFTLTIDLENHLFDVQISGLRADNTAFHGSAENVAFSTGFSTINLLYLENAVPTGGSEQFGAYFTHIDLAPVPEPGSTALLLGGAGVAFGFWHRKQVTSNRK